MDRMTRPLAALLLLLVLGAPALAETLHVDITASLSDDRLDPAKGNTTLKVQVKSQAEYRDLTISAVLPTASKLTVEPPRRTIDIIGAEETRGEYRFQILDRGQDPGSYRVVVNVSDTQGNWASKSVLLFVGGESTRLPAPGALEAIGALGLLFLLGRIARRRG